MKTLTEKKTLYYEQMGDEGPETVFLPGITGTTSYWKEHVQPLAATRRITLVDPLGFGNSPKPNVDYSIDRHLDELYAILQGKRRLTLVGHSFGAILAVSFAARYPDMVEKLVLISLPYYGTPEQTVQFFRGGSKRILTHTKLAALLCIVSRKVLGPVLPLIARNMPKQAVADHMKHTWRSFTSTFQQSIYGYDLNPSIDQISGGIPVVCLHGDQDSTAPVTEVERLTNRLANWKLRIMPGAGHHPWVHNPQWCLNAISDY